MFTCFNMHVVFLISFLSFTPPSLFLSFSISLLQPNIYHIMLRWKVKIENYINYHNFVSTHKNKKTGKATKFKTLKHEKIVTDRAKQRNLNPKLAVRQQRQCSFMAGSQKIQEITFESAKYKSSGQNTEMSYLKNQITTKKIKS